MSRRKWSFLVLTSWGQYRPGIGLMSSYFSFNRCFGCCFDSVDPPGWCVCVCVQTVAAFIQRLHTLMMWLFAGCLQADSRLTPGCVSVANIAAAACYI